MPTLTVLYFAALSDRLARSHDQIDLPADTTAEAILSTLAKRHPAAADLFAHSRVAVDLAFVSGAVQVTERSEIAVIPPVSGG